MRTSRLILLSLLFLFSTRSSAQQYVYSETEFTIPGEEADEAVKVRTFDGGNLICATTQNPSTFVRYTYFIKLDTAGAIVWTKRFILNCYFRQTVQCPDSGFIFCAEDNNNWTSYQLIKLDKDGNLIYSKRITAPGHPTATPPEMLLRNNGNIYLGATVLDSAGSNWHWHIFQLDQQGSVVSSNVYHSYPQSTEIAAMDTFSNGDLLVLGSWYNNSTGQHSPLIDRIDSSGAIVWSKKLAAASTEMKPHALESAGNNRFYVSTIYLHLTPFGYVGGMTYLKIDGGGNVLWSYRYEDYPVQFGDIITNSNSETCIIGGDRGYKTMFLRIDSTGNLLNSSCFPRRYFSCLDTAQGGMLSMCGINYSNKKIVLEVTSATGESCIDSGYVITKFPISTYAVADSGMYALPLVITNATYPFTAPNIAMSLVCSTVDINETQSPDLQLSCFTEGAILHVNCIQEMNQIDVFDCEGKLIYSEAVVTNTAAIDLTDFPSGVYVVQASVGGEIIVKKFLTTN